MTLPTHTFSPGNLGLPYGQEINQYMTEKGLLIREHDLDLGPDSQKRFEAYVAAKPKRIHVAPYLIRDRNIGLVWVHRAIKAGTMKNLDAKSRKKLEAFLRQQQAIMRVDNYFDVPPKPIKAIISVATYIQGGEAEADYFGLGYTWMPGSIWDHIKARVITVDWTMLDTRISEACMLLGERPLLHWDCVASHEHIFPPNVDLDHSKRWQRNT